MRNYVKHHAIKAADTINILNPTPVQRRLATTSTVRVGEGSHWAGPRPDLHDEELRKLEDGNLEVVSLFFSMAIVLY
jgi:hypothetical protein